MASANSPPDLKSAMTLHSAGRLAEARPLYMQLIAGNPDYFEAIYLLGVLEVQARDFARAAELLTRAAALDPMNAAAHSNAGIALRELDRPSEALKFFDHAATLEPGNADIQYNRANILWAMERVGEAAEAYGRVIALRPDYAEAHFNLGNIHLARGDHAEAIAAFSAALTANPKLELAQGMLLHSRMVLADWRGFDAALNDLCAAVARGERACQPFAFLTLTDSPSLHRRAAENWARGLPLSPAPRLAPNQGKIRLGYFSMDFHNHPVSQLTADIFRLHDRARFDVFAFSYGPNNRDDMRQQLERSFDGFFDVYGASDNYIRDLARAQRLDIAVDLAGYTSGARPTILTGRVAPVQVNYLGYASTMGSAHMDYMIADRVVIPDKTFYAEKIASLAGCYQANSDTRAMADVVPTRKDAGLPENVFVFCCFNNVYKITRATFDGWMRILRAVEGSVLWLLEDNATATANLRGEASVRGIDPDRLVVAPRTPRPAHLARHRLADLFLDTLPYNAHTTCGDALWAGLPLLTCAGQSFAARVGASLLTAVGMPELITTSQAAFEETAIALARDPARLAVLRAKLAYNRTRAPLFDIVTYTRQLESAYAAMAERARAGLPPVHIQVPD